MAEEKSSNVTVDLLPSPEDFCLTVPLYQQFQFDKNKLEQFEGTLDCFCQGCGRHTVFNRIEKPDYSAFSGFFMADNYVFILKFACARNKNHCVCFVFRQHQGFVQKIGQYPSLADLAKPNHDKYRPVLSGEELGELKRAVGLASHGIGVGAFVYLRRIFEALIEKAKQAAATEPGWDDAAFAGAHMDEKIGMLKQHLPKFLVEHRSLYGIMSVGVHTLSERECLHAFPIVRQGIELILNEQLDRHTRKKDTAETTKDISELGSALKNN
jgi:hypothetical protein